jgi:hypothetical protein
LGPDGKADERAEALSAGRVNGGLDQARIAEAAARGSNRRMNEPECRTSTERKARLPSSHTYLLMIVMFRTAFRNRSRKTRMRVFFGSVSDERTSVTDAWRSNQRGCGQLRA